MIFLKLQILAMDIPFKIHQLPLMNTQSLQLQYRQQRKAIRIMMSVYLILHSVNQTAQLKDIKRKCYWQV